MSKVVFAVVQDEDGSVTVEIPAGSTAAVRSLLPQVTAVLDGVDALSAPSPAADLKTAAAHALCAKYGVPVGANGQLVAALIALMQAAGPALEQILPAIEAIIGLFGKTQTAPAS
jgi:hypothetical protein